MRDLSTGEAYHIIRRTIATFAGRGRVLGVSFHEPCLRETEDTLAIIKVLVCL